MKMDLKVLMVLLFSLAFGSAFAQTEVPVTDLDFLSQMLQFIGGYKVMASAAAILAGVQLVVLFLKTPMSGKLFLKVTSPVKFLIVNLFTIVAGYLTLIASGTSASEAVLKTLALPLFQEFAFQIYKQFIQKKP